MAIFKKKGDKKAAKETDKKDKSKAADKAEKQTEKKSMKELYQEESIKETAKKGGKKESKSAPAKVNLKSRAYRILQHPLVTEKNATMASQNKYAFAVDIKTNKVEIAKAVSELYGIKPEKVNIIRMEGKVVQRGRFRGKRKDWKKAIVTLPQGKTIDIFEGV